MPSLNMSGPYDWDSETIESVPETIGNYALGYKMSDGSFCPNYVGRVEKGTIRKRLMEHLNECKNCRKTNKCNLFKYSSALHSIDTYKKECMNYHEFSPRCNEIHPDKLEDSVEPCPYFGCDK